MEFQTKYNREKYKEAPEKNSGELLVNRAGYVSAKVRIENLINAGARLVHSREELYDFNHKSKDEEMDNFDASIRSKNLDLVDLQHKVAHGQAVLKEVQRRAAAKASEKAQNEQNLKNSTNIPPQGEKPV